MRHHFNEQREHVEAGREMGSADPLEKWMKIKKRKHVKKSNMLYFESNQGRQV